MSKFFPWIAVVAIVIALFAFSKSANGPLGGSFGPALTNSATSTVVVSTSDTSIVVARSNRNYLEICNTSLVQSSTVLLVPTFNVGSTGVGRIVKGQECAIYAGDTRWTGPVRGVSANVASPTVSVVELC